MFIVKILLDLWMAVFVPKKTKKKQKERKYNFKFNGPFTIQKIKYNGPTEKIPIGDQQSFRGPNGGAG